VIALLYHPFSNDIDHPVGEFAGNVPGQRVAALLTESAVTKCAPAQDA
jgi:hypothetical protein